MGGGKDEPMGPMAQMTNAEEEPRKERTMPKFGMRIEPRTTAAMTRGRIARTVSAFSWLAGGARGGRRRCESGRRSEEEESSEAIAEPSMRCGEMGREEEGEGGGGRRPVRCSIVEMRGVEARAYFTTGLIYIARKSKCWCEGEEGEQTHGDHPDGELVEEGRVPVRVAHIARDFVRDVVAEPVAQVSDGIG